MSRGVYILLALFSFSVTLIFCFNGSALADSPVINDLSWPNCGEKLSSLTATGIVGVNDGLDFAANPCLAEQTQLFHNSYSLYLNTGYPGVSYGLKFAHYPNNCGSHNYLCLAYNYGYNDGLYSIKYANQQNAHSFVWWLDVETENSWTSSYKQNREALIGMINALNSYEFMPTIGFYSYPGQWRLITKNWHNYYPVWVASASSSKGVAIQYCYISFNKGSVWLSQYTTKLDYNYSCLPNYINNFKLR